MVRNKFQYTHHIRGATQLIATFGHIPIISIHAPHTWCDVTKDEKLKVTIKFQYTHHIRGATIDLKELLDEHDISIHAPHTWCDPVR